MAAFTAYMRTILDRAGREAQADRSTTIEAHHVLLAIAGQPDTAEGQLLTAAGLDRSSIRAALDREYEQSLGAAGVSLAAFDRPRPSTDPERPKNLGASVRLALERGVGGVRDEPRPGHLLLGVLQAQIGTVPRALGLAGVDRADLVARLRERIAADAP